MGRVTRRGWVAGLLGVLVLSGGCATNRSGQARQAARAVTSMQTTRAELAKAQAQVEDVLAALDQLDAASPGALPKAYRTFTRQVSRTVKQANTARRRADEMRQRWQDYIVSWEKESEQFSTPELRAGAAERREAVRRNYDRLQEAARATAAAYPPFLTQLRDIQKALALDLTPAGVRAARPAFESARNMATALKAKIANFMAQIDLVLAVSPPKK